MSTCHLSCPCSTSVDAWAVGILTYELLVGLPPFSDSQRATIEDKIRHDVPKFGAGVSGRARDFINTALSKEAHLRWVPWRNTAGWESCEAMLGRSPSP